MSITKGMREDLIDREPFLSQCNGMSVWQSQQVDDN